MRGIALGIALVVLAAVAASLFVSSRQRREARRLHSIIAADIDTASFASLRRAQALALRLALADPADAEAAAEVAFAGALLTTEFGEPLKRGTTEMAARAGSTGEAAVIGGAARALILLREGRRDAAEREAIGASRVAAGMPQPLYALGRVRSRAGDLVAASRALEAAMVEGPAFMPARIAWAEVRLDLGDADTAALALRDVVAGGTALGEPTDGRARLFHDEAERGRGRPGAGCGNLRPASAFEAAGCALSEASRSRLARQRARARDQALLAAEVAPDEPRLLARTAVMLALLGTVDRAAALVERAARFIDPAAPALAWAKVSVALGRGVAPAVPQAPRPPRPEGTLLEARAAFASGGVGALEAVLDRAGKEVVAADPDLAELSRLSQRSPSAVIGLGAARNDPLHAYVDGLRARLAGDLQGAAQNLARALGGHGDACRAAGEYLAALRLLKLKPPDGAFGTLRADSAECVNLPRLR